MSKEIVLSGPGAVAAEVPSVNALIELARAGGSVETMERLVALVERTQEREARRDFIGALAAFRAECPQPRKTRENSQFSVTRDGRKQSARYAPLEEIDRVARPVAAKHGLAWTWNTASTSDAITVTCRLFHSSGHYEDSVVTLPTESKAGSSPQQKLASAQTYGMRYSLIAALGITTAEDDVDGQAEAETITESQALELVGLARDAGADMVAFLAWLEVERIDHLPASRYEEARSALERKKKAREGSA